MNMRTNLNIGSTCSYHANCQSVMAYWHSIKEWSMDWKSLKVIWKY